MNEEGVRDWHTGFSAASRIALCFIWATLAPAVVARMSASEIRDRSSSLQAAPGFHGACHRAGHYGPDRWFHSGYTCCGTMFESAAAGAWRVASEGFATRANEADACYPPVGPAYGSRGMLARFLVLDAPLDGGQRRRTKL